MDQYILDGKTPVPCPDMVEYARWWAGAKRHVADDRVGEIRISTVFLGLDHSFDGGTPILFETLVFGGPLDQEMNRYATWEEAEAGHQKMLARVRAAASEEKRWANRQSGRPS